MPVLRLRMHTYLPSRLSVDEMQIKKKTLVYLPSRKHAYTVYNSDPLAPNFYIVKLGFTGVYIIFLISG